MLWHLCRIWKRSRVRTMLGTPCRWGFWKWARETGELRERLPAKFGRKQYTVGYAEQVSPEWCPALPGRISATRPGPGSPRNGTGTAFVNCTFDKSRRTKMSSRLSADQWCTFGSYSNILRECSCLWMCFAVNPPALRSQVTLPQSVCRPRWQDIGRISPSTFGKVRLPLCPFGRRFESSDPVPIWEQFCLLPFPPRLGIWEGFG